MGKGGGTPGDSSNLKTTADALPYYIAEKNIQLFARHKVFTRTEVYSRYEILLENYCKVINIEALTMLDMVKKDILPAVIAYSRELSDTILSKKLQMECSIYQGSEDYTFTI